MKVHCHTNLDLMNEVWPKELPCLPNIGDRIQSTTKWNGGFQLELEVYNITWKFIHTWESSSETWIPCIELHIPKLRKWSIVDFYEWYAPLVRKSVSEFI